MQDYQIFFLIVVFLWTVASAIYLFVESSRFEKLNKRLKKENKILQQRNLELQRQISKQNIVLNSRISDYEDNVRVGTIK